MCFSQEQLNYIIRTSVRHYNIVRPRRGIGMDNEMLDKTFRPQFSRASRSTNSGVTSGIRGLPERLNGASFLDSRSYLR